jgi:hypothetical protein
MGELEWEHAVVSADDHGESEVEQLYVEHQFAPQVGMRAGLVLIPLGLLNEHHEPGNYCGVERNFVETAITQRGSRSSREDAWRWCIRFWQEPG